MARDYANIITAIWRDPAFRALNGSAQRTYLLLVTQPDISAAGTLALTVRRWAQCATDTTPASIEADLRVLEAAGFVFVDGDTEELLIRTFAKHDKGYNNPKRKPVIVSAAKVLQSLRLRTVLWRELARLGLSESLPELPGASMDSLSDRHADTHTINDRVVVQVGLNSPQPSTREIPPQAGAASATAAARQLPLIDAPAVDDPVTAQQLVAHWIDLCRVRPPGRVIGHMSSQIKKLVEEGISAGFIQAGLDEFVTKDVSPSLLPDLVNAAMNRRERARASPAVPLGPGHQLFRPEDHD